MVFIGVYRSLFDYAPQDTNEIPIKEGDLLCILEKGEDDWWKAKKKAQSDDDDEPEGLIPANYVEEVKAIGNAKALFEYTRQTDEELSFPEDATLEVFDQSDVDWTLVGFKGEYGFAPANYIELEEAPPPMPVRPRAAPEPKAEREPLPEPSPRRAPTPSPPTSPIRSPAAALAGIIGGRANGTASSSRHIPSPPPEPTPPRKQVQFSTAESDDEAPALQLPRRAPTDEMKIPSISRNSRPKQVSIREPSLERASVLPSPPHNRVVSPHYDEDRAHYSPGGFRMYNIFEIIEALGKNRKTPVTLGINLAKGVISISSGESKESKEWTADRLSNYSIEGKHVFMELVRPSKSIDFHAGAKETAQEIVVALGELAGAVKADGLQHEIFSGGQKLGKILYNFNASASDEVSVKADDEVIVLDDTKSDEWWLVRRLKNGKEGKEGMVPSSYVEITGTMTTAATVGKSLGKGKSFVEKNRLEEERLSRAASSAGRDEVGPGLKLPARGSSLSGDSSRTSQKPTRDSKDGKSGKKTMPDARKVRTWTDHSGSFKVEAAFLGLKDGKINLHKINGVKIAVPLQKMSATDLEYVEKATGQSLEEEKSLADIKRSRSQKSQPSGASVENKPQYDWFDFFLQCGVNPQICERYAQAFRRDEMGPESMQDITPSLLRSLGIKEGDILRVMKFLDTKFKRTRTASPSAEASSPGGLFTGSGGALRNNTQRRPTPANPAKDVVDASVFDQKTGGSDRTGTPSTANKPVNGFEDEAWALRESKSTPAQGSASQPKTQTPEPAKPAVTGGQADLLGLSLSTPALQPTPAPKVEPKPETPSPVQSNALPGATPSLFEQLAKSPANQAQIAPPRQRPLAPTQTQTQGSLIAPPPQRAASAPQSAHSAFNPPPLQPQMTGYAGPMQLQTQISPPGQSLQELSQQRAFQQQQAMMPQPTGFQPMPGFNPMGNGLMPQATGYGGFPQPQAMGYGQFQQPHQTGFQPSLQQALINGQQIGSPFADPTPAAYQSLQPQPTGINAFLPPALVPQRTGPAPPVSFGGMNGAPPVPPIPQDLPAKPLVPQRTGPPPPVRFGVNNAPKKLAPQPTGKRANLSAATPHNPFGF